MIKLLTAAEDCTPRFDPSTCVNVHRHPVLSMCTIAPDLELDIINICYRKFKEAWTADRALR